MSNGESGTAVTTWGVPSGASLIPTSMSNLPPRTLAVARVAPRNLTFASPDTATVNLTAGTDAPSLTPGPMTTSIVPTFSVLTSSLRPAFRLSDLRASV